MAEKQQIIPVSLAVSCETYNCLKKVSWAIGRPDGPRNLWSYYCDNCMRDIVASTPAELLLVKSSDLIAVIRQEIEAGNVGYQDVKAILDMFANHGLLSKSIEHEDAQEETGKTFVCKFCGKEFDSVGALGNHVKKCPVKRGG